MMEDTEHLQHFVYLCEASGKAVKLVCVGKCGDGLEDDLFTCGGCGGQTAWGVDDTTLRLLWYCVSAAKTVWGIAEWQAFTCTCSHHLWSGEWVWSSVNLRMIHMSIKLCVLSRREPSDVP